MDTDISSEEEHQLILCAEEIHNQIKLDYDDEKVQEQKEFMENIVDVITAKVGVLYPVYQTHPKLPNGSFYQRTKIGTPNEFDFLNPLVFSDSFDIKIESYKKVYISDELEAILSDPRKHYKAAHCTDTAQSGIISNELNPYKTISVPINKAVREALTELHSEEQLKYIGKCDLKRYNREVVKGRTVDPDKLKLNEILLDENVSGPCITLAVGGPLCVAHVDMTFCLKDHQGKSKDDKDDEKFFVLPRIGVWISTRYTPGHFELDEPHRKILMILKNCLRESKRYEYETKYDSHLLKMVVASHKESCDGISSLGKCFFDVAQRIFRLAINKVRTNDENLYISSRWLDKLKNVGYPPIHLLEKDDNLEPGDMIFTLVLYTLVGLMKSSPDAVFSLCTPGILSVCLQLIAKNSSRELVKTVDTLGELILRNDVQIKNIDRFIIELKNLRNRGGEVNLLLSAPPFPYRPFWPDPDSPINVAQDGTVKTIKYKDNSKRWRKWNRVIKDNRSKVQRDIRQHEFRLQRITCQIMKRPDIFQRRQVGPREFREQSMRHREEIRRQALKRKGLKHQEEIRREEVNEHSISAGPLTDA